MTDAPRIFHFLMIFALVFSLHTQAAAEIELVPDALSPALEEFLSLPGQSNFATPDETAVDRIIDFLDRPKDPSSVLSMGNRNGATSNYSEFRLNREFNQVLKLIYNPEIPSYLTSPASVRRSEWLQLNGKKQGLPMLSDVFDKLTRPMVYTGLQYMENTPDTFSGAYYAYELERALVLTRHKGRKVLISISRQRGKSNVGKKGLVLGDDDNWNYLYTDEKGCAKTGLGWVKSYMYDSASIVVYYELDGPSHQVQIGIFKWLKAGWAGMNMVQPHHIKKGIERFAKNLKALVESPALTDTAGLSKGLRRFGKMPVETLRQQVKRHYLTLKETHRVKNRKIQRWFDQFAQEDGYLARMTPEEMRAVLEKAYLKKVLANGSVAKTGMPAEAEPKSKLSI